MSPAEEAAAYWWPMFFPGERTPCAFSRFTIETEKGQPTRQTVEVVGRSNQAQAAAERQARYMGATFR